jgi:hypothetical protein
MKLNRYTTLIFVAAAILFGGRSVFAQAQVADRNFEAVLYVVAGSDNAAGRSELPKPLAGIARQIREDFSFNNLRLVNTYVARISQGGRFEMKGLSDFPNREGKEFDSPGFTEWYVQGMPNYTGSSLAIGSFRFNLRLPVTLNAEEGGKNSSTVVRYENAGLTVDRLEVAPNTSLLVGTIPLSKSTGTLFLILSVRPA